MTGAVPESVADGGIEHVGRGLKPPILQVRLTVPVKPWFGVIISIDVALIPAINGGTFVRAVLTSGSVSSEIGSETLAPYSASPV